MNRNPEVEQFTSLVVTGYWQWVSPERAVTCLLDDMWLGVIAREGDQVATCVCGYPEVETSKAHQLYADARAAAEGTLDMIKEWRDQLDSIVQDSASATDIVG